MIDEDGFRANVGIILNNAQGQLLWAKRAGSNNGWQFPQGGIKQGESPKQALYRELYEEIGLQPEDVNIIDTTGGWLKYRLPQHLIRTGQTPLCIGQKQRWFLLQLLSDDSAINLHTSPCSEFEQWRWVSYWYPIDQVIAFKRNVYRRALKALAPAHCQLQRMR
ncbi:MAG: RNA pyrophosphohydrolase [Cellvibrionaceae bacterium]|nr:RNA pyrophosphohydrolase [Cellvibrionaceae bacterium]